LDKSKTFMSLPYSLKSKLKDALRFLDRESCQWISHNNDADAFLYVILLEIVVDDKVKAALYALVIDALGDTTLGGVHVLVEGLLKSPYLLTHAYDGVR